MTDKRSPESDSIDSDSEFLSRRVVGLAAPVLVALLVVLAGVLTLAALGIPITPSETAVAVAAYGAVAIAIAIVMRSRYGRGGARRAVVRGNQIIAAVLTVIALGGSLAIAVWLQPATSDRFVTLQTTAEQVYTAGALTSEPGATVSVGWDLRGYGVALAGDPVVTVAVDGTAPDDLSFQAAPDPAPVGEKNTSSLAGTVSFSAPTVAGRYDVKVVVGDAADPAHEQELVLQLEVTG